MRCPICRLNRGDDRPGNFLTYGTSLGTGRGNTEVGASVDRPQDFIQSNVLRVSEQPRPPTCAGLGRDQTEAASSALDTAVSGLLASRWAK